ncbi:MAG: PilN domain-containing protein [Acidobacteriota bacterium]
MTPAGIEYATELAHQTEIPALRRWQSIGSGVGIEIGAADLYVSVVVVRPGGIRVIDAIEIVRYRERPAADWGEEYRVLLERHKLKHVAAAVLLPSQDCVARTLAMPGVESNALAAAVRYQLDGLHPFAEEEAVHSFGRLSGARRTHVSVAVAKQEVIQDYATLFAEAGVAVAAFLSPAAAVYSAIRVLQDAPVSEFLAVHEQDDGLLLYGETEAAPLYCVKLPGAGERGVYATAAQIRLPEGAPVVRLASILPVSDKQDVARPLAYVAALASALPRLILPVNLLPVEQRKSSSRLRWLPTAVLVLLLVVLGVGYASYEDYENGRLLERLDQETGRLTPRLKQVRQAESAIQSTEQRLKFLSEAAAYPGQDLELLRELTRLLPLSAWVQRLDMTRNEVVLTGEFDQALELLKMLDASPLLRDSEFMAPPSRTPNGKEVFQIRAKREFPQAGKAAAAVAPAGAGLPANLPKVAPPPPQPAGVR